MLVMSTVFFLWCNKVIKTVYGCSYPSILDIGQWMPSMQKKY